MKPLPLVSVVIPTYNCAPYLPRAVESALGQTFAPVEVIVVDDGSTDDTAQVLAPYEGRIQYIRQANRKLPGARNTGIRHARGELIAFLDADDWWLPEKLERQVPLLLDNPDVGMVHSDFVFYDEPDGRYRPSNSPGHELVGRCRPRLLLGNAINVCTAVVRRECFDRAGLFNEGLVGGLEDYDLWLRVARHYEFAYVPQVLAGYRRHGDNMSRHRLRMDQAELAIAQRELKADPSLWEAAGKGRVRWKVFHLSSEIGQAHLEAGDLLASRQYFEQALENLPPRLALWRECFGIGYAYWENGYLPEAHQYFGRALRRRVASPYLWALWLATLLPLSWVERLRRWKAPRGPANRG
jgi:glycosyltransferase involved in cell wall biosynthesis